MRRPAFFCVLVLTGEEIPDLYQKLASEHPDTDPFLREVNRYHRQEEARHLNFARMLLPELCAKATRFERFQIRHLAPLLLDGHVRHARAPRRVRGDRSARLGDVEAASDPQRPI